MSDETNKSLEAMDTELANLCAKVLQMALTVAQVHAENPQTADSIGRLAEARLVVHGHGHDLSIEVLAPAADGRELQLLRLDANSAPAWTLN